MSFQCWFAHDGITVGPGDSATLSLTIENAGPGTGVFTVVPAGLSAGWTTVSRSTVTLFEGSVDTVDVVVAPPPVHSSAAGPTVITVRVIPRDDPDDTVTAETTVDVLAFDDRRITLLRPVQRSRRRARYELMVENHGNNLANCRLHLVDPTDRVDGAFDPPAVGVGPGGASLVHLDLRARGRRPRRRERQLDFEIEAAEPDHRPAVARATLIQSPTIAGRTVLRVLATLVVLGGAVGAWFGVVRPELRDAAQRAVDDRITELTGVPAPSVPADDQTAPQPTPTVAPAVVATPTQGEPVSYRITVDVGISQNRSESVTVPPDSRFHLTDVVPQNPNGDLGTAQLLRNGDVLYEWDLGAMTAANEFQPRITPIPFEPSDNIVLAVSCEVAGETTATGCSVSILLGGRLLPADG